jgi:hypothetical protein
LNAPEVHLKEKKMGQAVINADRTGTGQTDRFNRQSHNEGMVAKAIEQQTAKLPSDVFLWAACGSITTSLCLQMLGKKEESVFVGQWAPTFLILGLYNKIVKVMGSDGNRGEAF